MYFYCRCLQNAEWNIRVVVCHEADWQGAGEPLQTQYNKLCPSSKLDVGDSLLDTTRFRSMACRTFLDQILLEIVFAEEAIRATEICLNGDQVHNCLVCTGRGTE